MLLYLIISIPLLLSAGFTLSYVFTAGEPGYRCLISECEDASNTTLYPSWLSNAVPYTSGTPATCSRYVVQNQSDSCSATVFANETQICDSWVYDPNEHTILSEWDLTCSRSLWMLTLVGTMNNVGQFFGLIFAGYISDRYGRRTILTLATTLSGISGLIHSFAVNYPMFVVFEFLDATAAAGIYSAGFLLGMEMVGKKRRVLGGVIVSCMYAVGEVFLGFAAMQIRTWRLLLRVIYVPGLLAVLLPFIIPESVRWLVAKGKIEEAEKVHRKMARANGLTVSEEAIRKFKEAQEANRVVGQTEKSTDGATAMEILRSPTILIRLLTCSFCWLTNTFVYYGLSLNSVAVAGDKYINFILVSAIEIPAYFLTWVLTDRLGRKPTQCGSFLLSGVFCLAIQFVPTGAWPPITLVIYLAGKCCITIAFTTVYVYTVEMFPTSLRHSLLGICSMTGRVGSMLAPQTPLLAQYMASLPLILFGCMALTAGLLSLVFPETLGTKLPDTVYEAEHIGELTPEKKSSDSPP